MEYITHPLISPNRIEKRVYQFTIAMHALDGNTLVVIPTGLGKTAIALIVASSRLYNMGGRVLMVAPTKPLVEQHLKYFQNNLVFPEQDDEKSDRFVMFTGTTKPETRKELWERSSLCFATPQVIKNDIIAGRYDLSDVTLMIVDETHRAVGNYSYVFLADRYMQTARDPLILGMTASPGGDKEKIAEICENLSVSIVETRTEEDPDVTPYIHERDVEIVNVTLPSELKSALNRLNSILDSRLEELRGMGFDAPKRQHLSMKSLNRLNASIQHKILEKDAGGFKAASIHAECMKLRHATGLAESQGCLVLKDYLEKLLSEGTSSGGTKAGRRIAQDPEFIQLIEQSLSWTEECHPKLYVTPDIVEAELNKNPESKIIIFATYRNTVRQIVDVLEMRGIQAARFVGQSSKDSDKGLSQKKQINTIQKFRDGEFRVLVATSVGEEGLDIPSTDLVIFYEPVPSEVRSIQRKGRTGRSGTGRIIVLVTKGTSDETSRFASLNRERAMVREIKELRSEGKQEKQMSLFSTAKKISENSLNDIYCSGPEIIVDDRETSSKVAESLSNSGAAVRLERLDFGDYQVSDRILVERKTTRDFVDTLIERDLLGQLKKLAGQAEKPVLIIEGENLYSQRDIHPNAIRGALASITVDLGISVLYTRKASETAEMLLVLARREQSSDRPLRNPNHKKAYLPEKEIMEEIIATFPEIGLRYARNLLEVFGSVQAVVNAEKEDILKVKGIGKKKADKFYALSRRSYK